MPKILKKGESAVAQEGKYWKFCHHFFDGSGFFYSQGFDTREEAEQAMKEHDTKTGRWAWRKMEEGL